MKPTLDIGFGESIGEIVHFSIVARQTMIDWALAMSKEQSKRKGIVRRSPLDGTQL